MKKFMICLLISIHLFTINVYSISNTYKEGIYQITDVVQGEFIGKLVGKTGVGSLVIVGSNGDLKFYKSFNVYNQPVELGVILNTDKIIIIGNGEIAIYSK